MTPESGWVTTFPFAARLPRNRQIPITKPNEPREKTQKGLKALGFAALSDFTNSIKKKKRRAAAVGPDKGGRGLRQFSMKVCEKVESKGRTTYNEQQYDEKNIRRRVYDALNVLMAMDIISKDKKEIQWKGLPRTSINDIEELQADLAGVKGRIEKKSAYLQELQDQYLGMQNLINRNEQLYGSGNIPTGGVALPFILIQFCFLCIISG
uniref:Transcription factor Dp n=1 Tax=Aegilops tauschii TaxID=37682 RepID=M8CEE6_AEGTA